MEKTKPAVVYEYKGGLYLNITNRCPTNCFFCVKRKWKMDYRGYNLGLEKEPSAEEIISDIEAEAAQFAFKELVFCGYGEPTMRLNEIIAISKSVRNSRAKGVKSDLKIRLNTNGLGNLVNGENIVLKLKDLVNSVVISVNTADREQWKTIMNPLPEYREKGFESVIEFARECGKNLDETVLTAIDSQGADMRKLSGLAESLNLKLKIRPGL